MQVAGIFHETGNKTTLSMAARLSADLKVALRRELGARKFVKFLQ